jgi:serine/threonine-protein kinase HipA
MQDQLRLLDLTVFNVLIGTADNHVKNISLVYGSEWETLRLAPAYDIVSTVIYPQSTRDMAFAIGGTRNLDMICRQSFESACDEVELGRSAAMDRVEAMIDRFAAALDEEAARMADSGFPQALALKKSILELWRLKDLS